MQAEDVPTIEEILSDYLDVAEFSDMLNRLRERENIMLTEFSVESVNPPQL